LTHEETFPFRGYDIPMRLALLTGGGPDTFEAISHTHISTVNAACGLRRGLNVVEVGCGIGRDAIPLTEILGDEGAYIGTDVIADSIRWCSEHVSRRHANFIFVHEDIADALHNPGGTVALTECTLPVPDRWADLVILQSVFTHMLPDAVRHYLREFERVLRPSGLVYATLFLIDDAVLAAARTTNLTRWNLRFEHAVADGVLVNDPEHPTGAVAYRADTLEALIGEAGLKRVGPVRAGAWSGAHPVAADGQDVLVLRKPDSAAQRSR
jgi:ubiquinone/menaquinone biosynthesis C-methylase UbiE